MSATTETNEPYSVLEAIQQHRGTMSVVQVAKILGLSRITVYEMIKTRSIPVMQLPGCNKKLFDPSVLAAWYRKYNRLATPLRKAS